MNNEEDIISINEVLGKNDDIEVLEVDNNIPSNNNETILNDDENVIDINRLFVSDEDQKSIDENELRDKKYDKLIEKIQIGLIIFLVISALLVYFFGYDLVEPFIKLE